MYAKQNQWISPNAAKHFHCDKCHIHNHNTIDCTAKPVRTQHHSTRGNGQYAHLQQPNVSINAPTGPKAMREGLLNPRGGMWCPLCQKSNHPLAECTRSKWCSGCEKTNHNTSECTKTKLCTICDMNGLMSRNHNTEDCTRTGYSSSSPSSSANNSPPRKLRYFNQTADEIESLHEHDTQSSRRISPVAQQEALRQLGRF